MGILMVICLIGSCKKDSISEKSNPTPYSFPNISNFRTVELDSSNPLTNEGVELGHLLFFDTRLSLDNTISCATCHQPGHAFSDPRRFSLGVNGTVGRRQSMSIFNMAWSQPFFWDGRAPTLEEQATFPVPDTTEMHLPWDEAIQRLQSHPKYVEKFKAAFGIEVIDKNWVAKAIAQYVKVLVSYNSPFDKYVRGEGTLSEAALRGQTLFNTEKADCFHCHSTPELFVRPGQAFANNGLDLVDQIDGFKDLGLGGFNGNPNDNGRFKVPSLRNLTMTAPYMHDGRFETLDEVIDFYNGGPKLSPTLEPIMLSEANRRVLQTGHWGLDLTQSEKDDLKAFLITLSDSTILNNPLYQAPTGI